MVRGAGAGIFSISRSGAGWVIPAVPARVAHPAVYCCGWPSRGQTTFLVFLAAAARATLIAAGLGAAAREGNGRCVMMMAMTVIVVVMSASARVVTSLSMGVARGMRRGLEKIGRNERSGARRSRIVSHVSVS